MDLACCLNKHLILNGQDVMSSCILRLYKSLVETLCQVALQRLVQRYFIGGRGFVVSNVKSVLHNL